MSHPTMGDLFSQLGLASDNSAIEGFIERHRGIPATVHIQDAAFWNSSQADFIDMALTEDAEWAEVIDQLDSRLR